jgi:hypothetical protein
MMQLLTDLAKSSKDSLQLDDEKFILIVDLLLFSPELHLEVKGSLYNVQLPDFSIKWLSINTVKNSPNGSWIQTWRK